MTGGFKTFLKSGHPPTLFASFLYFDFCFAIWVLNGAMAPFISEEFHLSPAQKGFMISVPIIAGALMRFPLGVLAQYIGRKRAALVEMSLILGAMAFGYFYVKTYHHMLIMGVMLGIAGASFGVALSLGSGWFPKKYKGLAMGIAGAGNSGTVLAVLLAPPLAVKYGWKTVYGFGGLFMLIPILVMLIFAKEPPDIEKQSLKEHLKCLWEKDGWVFNLVYIITFGGFIGLSNFLPTYFYDQFGVTKVEAGQLTMLAALMGSGIRIVGGAVSDRFGGITTLTFIFGIVIVGIVVTGAQNTVTGAVLLFMMCFAALGAGNGALFQLVPLRWPTTTAVAGSMIGEIGALGGGIIPNAMGQSKQHTGSYFGGFLAFAGLAVVAFVVLRVAQRRWTRTWVSEGGRARLEAPIAMPAQVEGVADAVALAARKAAAGALDTFHSIIYPVGHSELAEKAGKVAAKMAKMSGAKVVLLFVEDKWHQSGSVMTDSVEWQQIREGWMKEGKELLEEEKQRLTNLGVTDIETEIRSGDVASEVVAAAKERDADLIVLASHQTSPLGKLLMGSRTFDIFKQATCPILRVVR
ncbi:MAG: MFS transporter [Polyangiaceae bacterium]|nr:MFS transporter [Polyangiaceae bacterium]